MECCIRNIYKYKVGKHSSDNSVNNYESRIKNAINNPSVIASIIRIVNNSYTFDDYSLIISFLKLNNGNLFVKQNVLLNQNDFDKFLFKNYLTRIYISDKKHCSKFALKKKLPSALSEIETFVGEVLIGQYLSYFAPEHVNSCVQYIDNCTYFIQYSQFIDGIEWSNANIKLTYKTLTVIKKLCNSLLEIHRLGVIHNDLKLDNILVDEKTLNVKIIDFDSSCFEDTISLFKRNVGTIIYMCPLLLCSESKVKRSKFTDLYCLVICIFYLISESGIQFDESISANEIMKMSNGEIHLLHSRRIESVKTCLKKKVSTCFLKFILEILDIETLLMDDNHMTSEKYLSKLMSMVNPDNIYINCKSGWF